MLSLRPSQTAANELKLNLSGFDGQELKAIEGHNERVDSIESAIAAQFSKVESGLPDCRTMKLSDARKLRDTIQQRTLELLQERATMAEDRVSIMDGLEASLQKALDAAEKELGKAREQTRKGLEKVGISAASNPVAHHDARAAEIQFDHQIQKSQLVRDAQRDLNEAEANMARLNTSRMQADIAIKATLDDLQAFVRQLCK